MDQIEKFPLFSVIIPTFNRREKLLRALNSLNAQTYLDFEVLICDDGSNDGTREEIDSYRKKIGFRALHYLYESNWGGPARPRNIGVRNAVGKWICYLDSDDSWHSNKLEKLLPHLDNSDLIYHDFEILHKNKITRQFAARTLHAPVFEDLLINGHNGCIINSGVCARSALIRSLGGSSERRLYIGVEDADLWLRMAKVTDRFTHIDEPLGSYYMDGGNLTAYNDRMIQQLTALFQEHAAFLKHPHQRKRAWLTHSYHLARIKRMMNQNNEALRMYLAAMGSPNHRIVLRSVYWFIYLGMKRIGDQTARAFRFAKS